LTFIHKFSRTVQCRVEISDEVPEPGTIGDREIFWSGRPKKKHVDEYLRFQHELNRTLADSWNRKLLLCFKVSKNSWQFWSYSPGEAPRLEKVGNEPEMPYTETNHYGVFSADEEDE
jgi:hypothetical protein